MDRRSSILAGFALAAGVAMAEEQTNAQSSGAIKVTVLYGHPKSPEDFEKYYFGTHMPMVIATKGARKAETSKCPPAADGSPGPFYRMFEIWFDSQADMIATTATPEWKKLVADLANFATGGITRVVSKVD
jgi:uncharacterized protein (TIGR02118 family)